MTSYRAKSFVSHRLYILLAPGVFTEDLERYSFDLECDFSLKHPSRIEGEFYSNIVSKTLSPYLSTWMSRIKEGSQDSDLPVERFQEPANFARKGDAGEVFKVPVVSDKIGEETDALERKISSVNLPLTDRVMSRQYLKGYLSGIKDIKLKGSRRCENEKCYLVSFEKKYFEGEKVFLEFWIGAESLNIYKMEEIDVVNGDTIALTEELHTGITMQ
jgi:hypothetical protein